MHENLIRPDLVGPVLARALGDSRWQRPQAALIPGGKSNLTFELTSGHLAGSRSPGPQRPDVGLWLSGALNYLHIITPRRANEQHRPV